MTQSAADASAAAGPADIAGANAHFQEMLKIRKSSPLFRLRTREEIRAYLGVDTLEYLTLDEMTGATSMRTQWCHACFSGDYPTPVQLTFGAFRAGTPLEVIS